jgi:hypothetical protein
LLFFFFSNDSVSDGRNDRPGLLLYHVDDTQERWHRAISTIMALLSDRISAIEVIQKSIQTDLNDVLDKTKFSNAID